MPVIKKRPIVLSAKRRSWRMMDVHADEHDKRYLDVREKVLQRDDYSCVFCLFRSTRYQHVHHVDDDHGNNTMNNLVTACPLCHQCFHLGMAGIRKSGIIVWLPEISQGALNNLCRGIFVAVQNAGQHEQAARSLYGAFESRAAIIEQELGPGSSNPAAFGQAFLHMSEEQYAARGKRLSAIRLLPRMQAFGAEIAYWQSDAFGSILDSDWIKAAPSVEEMMLTFSESRKNVVRQNSATDVTDDPVLSTLLSGVNDLESDDSDGSDGNDRSRPF